MNNYERIKAMSIEEFAELVTNPDNEFHLYCSDHGCPEEYPNEVNCRNCFKQWLESESEDE